MEPAAYSVTEQVARAVMAGITSGRFPVGSLLPAERELARQLHASRGSVRLALALLRQRGLVTPAPQSGWFITDSRLGEPVNTLISFTEMTARRGLTPRTRVLRHEVRAPTFEEVAALAVTVGDSVLDVSRVRSLEDTPVCVDSSLIALSRAVGMADVDLTDTSLYEELTRLGAAPHRSSFTVEAGRASGYECVLLEIEPGAPVLITEERCFDQHGAVLLCGRGVYRANAYRFHAELRRR